MPQLIIRLSPYAQADLVRIKRFLDDFEPNISETVVKKIMAGLRRLQAFPKSAKVVNEKEEIRELLIVCGRSGYAARYIITETSVVVLALRHQKEEYTDII